MTIKRVSCFLNTGMNCPIEEANEVWISVSFHEDEAIMKDPENVPDAFIVMYQWESDEMTLLNEGLTINWTLDDEEKQQIRDYYKSLIKSGGIWKP